MKFIAILAAIASVIAAETAADTPSSGPRCDFDLATPFGYHACYVTRIISTELSSNVLANGVRKIQNNGREEYYKHRKQVNTFSHAFYKLKPGVDPNNVRCDFKKINMKWKGSYVRIGYTSTQESVMHKENYKTLRKYTKAKTPSISLYPAFVDDQRKVVSDDGKRTYYYKNDAVKECNSWNYQYISHTSGPMKGQLEYIDKCNRNAGFTSTPILDKEKDLINISARKADNCLYYSQYTGQGESKKMTTCINLQEQMNALNIKQNYPFLTLQIKMALDEYVEVIEDPLSAEIKELQDKIDALEAKKSCKAKFSAYKTEVHDILAKLRAEAKKTIMKEEPPVK